MCVQNDALTHEEVCTNTQILALKIVTMLMLWKLLQNSHGFDSVFIIVVNVSVASDPRMIVPSGAQSCRKDSRSCQGSYYVSLFKCIS